MRFFCVLGERCSGTHFIEHAVATNFDLECRRVAGKHFWTLADLEALRQRPDVLVLCVVRSPVAWVDSFFKRHHHVPKSLLVSAETFVTKEWLSEDMEGREMMCDRHLLHGRRYTDLLELRLVKHASLLAEAEQNGSNFVVVAYEAFRDDYDRSLAWLEARCGLARSAAARDGFVPIVRYKGTYAVDFAVKPVLLSAAVQAFIAEKVDDAQEQRLLALSAPGAPA